MNFGEKSPWFKKNKKILKKCLTKAHLCVNIIFVPQGMIVGANDSEGPPVPIPNTEVKLTGAENTWVATPWEDRKAPTQRLLNRAVFFLRPLRAYMRFFGARRT